MSLSRWWGRAAVGRSEEVAEHGVQRAAQLVVGGELVLVDEGAARR